MGVYLSSCSLVQCIIFFPICWGVFFFFDFGLQYFPHEPPFFVLLYYSEAWLGKSMQPLHPGQLTLGKTRHCL